MSEIYKREPALLQLTDSKTLYIQTSGMESELAMREKCRYSGHI